jgi:Spy/CpxP family protein refolding chaperone
MQTIGKLTLAVELLAALGMASTAKAQMSTLGMMAIIGPEGKKELNLTEDQVAKVREVMRNLRETVREKNRALMELPAEERVSEFPKMIREADASAEKELRGILQEDQFERYRQITLQVNSINSFRQEDVLKKLELTDDQKAKIEAIMAEASEEMRQTQADRNRARQAGDLQAPAFLKLREIRQKSQEKILAVLTEVQRGHWKQMIGKDFNFEIGPAPGDGTRRRPID